MCTVDLSVATLISLMRKENLGEPHAVLAGAERYISPRFQEHAERAVRDELDRAGVRLDDLRDRLALIRYARVEYYGWITDRAGSTGVLVAARGRAAVMMTRAGDRITLSQADPDRLAESLIHRLPHVLPGRGDSISIRAADYTPPNARTAGHLCQPVSARSQDARRLDTLLRAHRTGGAQLYAVRRDNGGVRRRAKEWINVLDLVGHGRWVVYATAGHGAPAVNAAPGTPGLLAAKLADLNRSPT